MAKCFLEGTIPPVKGRWLLISIGLEPMTTHGIKHCEVHPAQTSQQGCSWWYYEEKNGRYLRVSDMTVCSMVAHREHMCTCQEIYRLHFCEQYNWLCLGTTQSISVFIHSQLFSYWKIIHTRLAPHSGLKGMSVGLQKYLSNTILLA